MDIQKLELLIKKIDQAVKVIQRLKNSEIKYQEEIRILTSENFKLKNENISLQSEIEQLKTDFQNNNILHKELESKIIEIIKCLPDDDETTDSKIDESTQKNEIIQQNLPEKNIQENIQSDEHKLAVEKGETEEEMLKSFVRNQEKNEDTNLFSNNEIISNITQSINEFPEESIEEPKELFEETIDSEEDKFDEIKKKFEFNFNDTLLEDEEKSEIDFNLDDSKKIDDLPKGVL